MEVYKLRRTIDELIASNKKARELAERGLITEDERRIIREMNLKVYEALWSGNRPVSVE